MSKTTQDSKGNLTVRQAEQIHRNPCDFQCFVKGNVPDKDGIQTFYGEVWAVGRRTVCFRTPDYRLKEAAHEHCQHWMCNDMADYQTAA